MPSTNEINVHYPNVYALVSQDRKSEQKWPVELTTDGDVIRWEVERNSWMWAASYDEQDPLFLQLKASMNQVPHSTLLVLSDVQENMVSNQNWIMNYTEASLFYAYNPEHRVIAVSMNEKETF